MKFLGKIAVTANGEIKNNRNTAAPFVIPRGAKAIGMFASIGGLRVELGFGDAFATTSTTSRAIAGTTEFLTINLPRTDANPVLSMYNGSAGAADLSVWALY